MTHRIRLLLENSTLQAWAWNAGKARMLAEFPSNPEGHAGFREFARQNGLRHPRLLTHDAALALALEQLPPELSPRLKRQLAQAHCRKRFPECRHLIFLPAEYRHRALLAASSMDAESSVWLSTILEASGKLHSLHIGCQLLPLLLPKKTTGLIFSRHRQSLQLTLVDRGLVLHRQIVNQPAPEGLSEALYLAGQYADMLRLPGKGYWLIDGDQTIRCDETPEIEKLLALADCTGTLLSLPDRKWPVLHFASPEESARPPRQHWITLLSLGALLSGGLLVHRFALPETPRVAPQLLSPPPAGEAKLARPPVAPAVVEDKQPGPQASPRFQGEIRFPDKRRVLWIDDVESRQVADELRVGDSLHAPLLPPGSLQIAPRELSQ
ncbi:MAG: hypothetical protein LWW83_04830 [Azonexaceae bacterium]|nr:hypothetical protein [Azonexaceae bacterium]